MGLYECKKEMTLQKCDGDGFWDMDEYGLVGVGSKWHKDQGTSIIGGDIHLECISGCDDFEWIEISIEKFKEYFEGVSDE